MRDTKYRAAAAEAEIHDIAKRAKDAIGKMESRSLLLEAAMRVIMKRGLLDEFSQELNKPTAQDGPQTEYDVLLAERDRYRKALEVIAGQPQCVLEAMQAKAALDNIGPPVSNGEHRAQ